MQDQSCADARLRDRRARASGSRQRRQVSFSTPLLQHPPSVTNASKSAVSAPGTRRDSRNARRSLRLIQVGPFARCLYGPNLDLYSLELTKPVTITRGSLVESTP